MSTPSDRLRHNILFESVDDATYKSIRQKLTDRHFTAQEIIVEDDSDGEELFLLAEGRVKILKRTKSGEENTLALLHPGDFFGELELVDGRPRSARVVAMDDCTVFVLLKSDFEHLLHRSHPFAIRLMEVLSIRLRASNNHFISELERNAQRSSAELGKLEQLIEASKVLNSTLDLDKLLNIILETALKIVNGDRGTVYLIDDSNKELWSKVLKGDELIRIELPMGKGIAGYVAVTGDTLNIVDAYLDPRFNPEVDRKTGYRTKTILCMPMNNKDGKIIGVFQLLNKRNGAFTQDDESFIAALSVHAAIAIENARLYEQEKRSSA
ncbi:MAG: cyclic nucleotide-binding domain-containing protein [Ignavibacteriales bacterium]|nr:cyclic nucleotide-binding domain-containing protein [Ignavibacteriales bacterium]